MSATAVRSLLLALLLIVSFWSKAMVETPDWPAYQVGSKDSIFALGMVSVNYARLEFAVHAIFATILGITDTLSYRLMFKIGPEMRDKLMREMLPARNWPKDVVELVEQFIEAHKTCYENRNKLMHSNLVSGSDRAITLRKMGRDGRTTLSKPLLRELRQVADDMKTYFDYGIHLSNMINLNLLGGQPVAGDPFFHTWPDKPPLPNPLEYTSNPTLIRAQE
jgi:hypothetical protein